MNALETLLEAAVKSVSIKEMRTNRELQRQTKKIVGLIFKLKKLNTSGDKNANPTT